MRKCAYGSYAKQWSAVYCRAPLCATTSPCASSTSSSPSEGRMKNFPWALLWAGAQFSRYSHALQSANSIYPAGVHHCVQKKKQKRKNKNSRWRWPRLFIISQGHIKAPTIYFLFWFIFSNQKIWFLERRWSWRGPTVWAKREQASQHAVPQTVPPRRPARSAPNCARLCRWWRVWNKKGCC